jgi:hypothetical protein
MPRQAVTISTLYSMLDAEFRKRRPAECRTCQVPLPFHRTPPDAVSANWSIGTPRACASNCQAILAQIAAELWPLYELKRPSEDKG